ncbi:unnamed protein product [Knipowitschia caucasica]
MLSLSLHTPAHLEGWEHSCQTRLPQGTLTSACLQSFSELTTAMFLSAEAKNGVEHHITTVGSPVYARAWRLDSAKLAIAKEEFTTMERLGIVWRSKSNWASPLHMVRRLPVNPQDVPKTHPLVCSNF